jgi:hypothetical protein
MFAFRSEEPDSEISEAVRFTDDDPVNRRVTKDRVTDSASEEYRPTMPTIAGASDAAATVTVALWITTLPNAALPDIDTPYSDATMVELITEIVALLLRPPAARTSGPPEALTDDVLMTTEPPLKGPPTLIAVPVVVTNELRIEMVLVVVPIKRIPLADAAAAPGPLVSEVPEPVMVTERDEVAPVTSKLFDAETILAEPPTQRRDGDAP